MEEKKNDLTASGEEKKTKAFKKYAIICLVVILAAAGIGLYNYNLPANRLTRALRQADTLAAENDYEKASAAYAEAEGINGVSHEALEGHILCELHLADELAAKAVDIPSRVEACDRYAQVIELCDAALAAVQNASDESFTKPRTEADGKRNEIQKGVAADTESVKYVTSTEDRSGSVQLFDTSEIPYTQYYDLVQVEDEYYPYSEIINETLRQQMQEYFADSENDPASAIQGAGMAAQDALYRDYVGLDGVYSADGLLCVRMAHVKIFGSQKSNDYCGTVFRLSDGQKLTLGELTGMTDIGLRRLCRRAIWSWMEEEGYADVKKSDVEDYVEDVDDADFKYCIRDDGTICLIVDQSVPFFAARDEILEIPIQIEEEKEE